MPPWKLVFFKNIYQYEDSIGFIEKNKNLYHTNNIKKNIEKKKEIWYNIEEESVAKKRGERMIKAYAKTDVGKVREMNQDYYYISDSLSEVQLYILADGMGRM